MSEKSTFRKSGDLANKTYDDKIESMEKLSSGVTHDLNNILFTIVGHSEMLLEDVDEDSPLRDSLNEIYSGALKARDLIKQITNIKANL